MSEFINIEIFAVFSVGLAICLIGTVIVSIKQINVAFDAGYDSGKYAGEEGLIAAENLSYKKGYAEGKNAGLLIGSCAQKSGPNPTKTPVKHPSKPSNTGLKTRAGNKPKPVAKKAFKGSKAK